MLSLFSQASATRVHPQAHLLNPSLHTRLHTHPFAHRYETSQVPAKSLSGSSVRVPANSPLTAPCTTLACVSAAACGLCEMVCLGLGFKSAHQEWQQPWTRRGSVALNSKGWAAHRSAPMRMELMPRSKQSLTQAGGPGYHFACHVVGMTDVQGPACCFGCIDTCRVMCQCLRHAAQTLQHSTLANCTIDVQHLLSLLVSAYQTNISLVQSMERQNTFKPKCACHE